MPGEPHKKSAISQLVENLSGNLIRLGYWRRRVISANTIAMALGKNLQRLRLFVTISPIK
jgi:hypothetical protein